MSNVASLEDVYADELKDLWSANDQMAKIVKVMSDKAHDPGLKRELQKSISGIAKHAATLKDLLSRADEKVEREHCKGMEGLVKEAQKHIGEEAPDEEGLLDVVIIAQYQRMSHYGLAGFGTAAAYAKALGRKADYEQLNHIVSDIYRADEFATKLAARAEAAAA